MNIDRRKSLLLFVALCTVLGVGLRSQVAAEAPGIRVTTDTTSRPTSPNAPQPPATVTFTPHQSLQQFLSMPDHTIVKSADGKQSTTVGAIPARVQAREQEFKTAIQSGKLLNGSHTTIPSPHGLSFNAALQDRIAQENKTAISLHTANLNAPSPIQQALHPTPGIHSVNGKTNGFVLSPGTNVIIKGAGFGATKQLTVMRGLPGGDIELTVLDWRDDTISAQLPATAATMRGLPDGAIAIVLYAQGNQYRLDGGTFYATRQDYVVTRVPAQKFYKVQFAPHAPLIDAYEFSVGGDFMRYSYHSGDDSSQLNLPCWSPGTDFVTTIDPGHGFVVTSLQFVWQQHDSGDGDAEGRPGSHWFAPGYSLGAWNGDTLPVNWGVYHSHTSPNFFDPSFDFCDTDYAVDSITVTGPAGMSPL